MSLTRNREVAKVEHAQGGKGYILRDLLLQGEQLHGKLTYASTITLDPGCEIGVHTHTGDSEMYFIYEGEGVYTDNAETYPVQPGDMLFCKDGESHGLENTGTNPLRFVAIMQASE
jgi:quercetin dioxygenase-like cupin family protein